MRYYVDRSDTGEVIGFMEYPYANETMTEVTEVEYYALRGEPVPKPKPEPTEILQLAVAELAETMAAQDISNKLAIAELAETTMGGES